MLDAKRVASRSQAVLFFEGQECPSSLLRVVDRWGFAVPEWVVGGEDFAVFVVDGAVFFDFVSLDGVIDSQDDGYPIEGFGIELGGAGDERGEDDGGLGFIFGRDVRDIGKAAFTFFE